MVAEEVSKKIGVGLYTPAEAAMYVRARTAALNRWLYGNNQGDRVFTPQFADERVVTFVDLIQALCIRNIRSQPPGRRISLQKIREAIENAKELYRIDSPLAYQHSLFAYDDTILIKLADNRLAGLTGRDVAQEMLVQIVEPFMYEIQFDQSGLANRWTPRTFKDWKVVLDPKLRFGQPIIEPGGFAVDALADAAVAEGSIEAAAEAFGVASEVVLLATQYRDSLTGLAA